MDAEFEPGAVTVLSLVFGLSEHPQAMRMDKTNRIFFMVII
jgi:hypothetical protein